MIAYLACFLGRPMPREKLAALLWGEREHRRARQNLRQVLHVLSRALARRGASLLRLDSQAVWLDGASVWIDVVEFEEVMGDGSPASLTRATDLYSGDFLADLRTDAPDFEDWVAVTRNRLQGMALKALTGRIEHETRAGRLDAAIEAAQRALDIDPFREDLHRRLMQLHLLARNRGSALAQYHRCRDVLRRELGIPPDEATTRLYQDIRRLVARDGASANPPAETTTEAESAPGIGRAPESEERDLAVSLRAHVDALRRWLAEAGWSRNDIVLIVGEAGAGKAKLADALARAIEEQEATVLRIPVRRSVRVEAES